jgi:xanthine dehydrogenase accessory factor
MNPYQIVEKKLKDNRAVLMVTKMHHGHGGTTEELTRHLFTEQDLLEGQTDLLTQLRNGRPHFLQEGEQRLVEPFFKREKMIIFGGGHIALPLCKMGSMVGFHVTVVDDRPSFANSARFPEADKVICNHFSKAFSELDISPNDFLVVITRGHRYDELCLREILSRQETLYTGMIGSKKRVATVFNDLRSEGFDAGRIQRICSPIGLAIGAVTPEEISISILSEMIQRKRKDERDAFLTNRSDMEAEMIPFLAKVDIPSALVTVIETVGSTPRNAGAKMLVGETGILKGSVGGGCSESDVMHKARSIIGTGKWEIVTVDLTQEDAEDEGMVCGGTMKMLIEDFH